MYKRAPTSEQLRLLGLSAADYAANDDEVVEVWPENLPVYDMWSVVGDQWRMGPSGPVALDMIPVFHEMDRAGLDKEEYDHLLVGIKTLASVALEEIHEGK